MTDAIILATHATALRQQWTIALNDDSVVEVVEDLGCLHKALKKYSSAIVMLDLSLPDIDACLCTQKILDISPGSKILAVSDTENAKEISALFLAGVRGICRKDTDLQLLGKAIQKVGDSEVWLERRLIGTVLSEIGKRRSLSGDAEREPRQSVLSGLTPREREIASLVADGLCQKEITRQLVISEHTVRNHLSKIFRKTGVNSSLQLALIVKSEAQNEIVGRTE